MHPDFVFGVPVVDDVPAGESLCSRFSISKGADFPASFLLSLSRSFGLDAEILGMPCV